MALRLTGGALRTLRTLAGVPGVLDVLWAASARDFGIPTLAALPASARAPLDDGARPLQGRVRHGGPSEDRPWPAASRPTVRDLQEAYREGRTTPVAVLESLLAHLEAGDFGQAGATPYVALDAARAREAAQRSAARWQAGEPLGPLDGVPVPVKDEMHVAGLPLHGGTAYRGQTSTSDAWPVRRLQRAGALVYGKTHATEWGLNPWGSNAHHDLPRNAWSSAHGAGGSSTGTGVAVALGHAPCGVGSDGGGSIRIPASLNGLYGLKPTFLRVGRTGDDWAPGTMSHLGPLGGSVVDCVALLEALVGADPEDPGSGLHPDLGEEGPAWWGAVRRGVKGLRIGVVEADWADADPRVARLGEAALDALVAAGAERVALDLPLAAHAPAVGALTIGSETAANLADDRRAHGPAYGDELWLILALMERLSAPQLLAVARTRAALRRQVAAAFAGSVDLIAMPTTATPAPPYPASARGVDTLDPAATAAMTRFAFLANLTGVPAGTVPVGRVDGLPVGLQLLGDAWDEATVIAAMASLERDGAAPVGAPEGWHDLLA